MKDFTNFNKTALRAVLRKSDRLICQPVHGWKILLCNGFCIWALTPAEYADIAQPVTKLEPGRWELTAAGHKDSDFDVYRIFNGYADKARTAGTVATEAAARFPSGTGKVMLAAYYTEKTVATFNSDYTGTVADPLPMLTGELDPVVYVSHESGPVAVVLPVRIKPEISAAVRALHGMAEAPETEAIKVTSRKLQEAENTISEKEKDISGLLESLSKKDDKIFSISESLSRAAAEAAALRAELAEAQETAAKAQREAADAAAALAEAQQAAGDAKAAAQAQPATVEAKPQNNIDMVAARFAEIPGIVITVKGAQTASPVAWLSGETQSHADELKAAGAKWSQKRSAFYFKIA